ncbi:MAG TPA: RNA methyltransferase [Ottowia sp.]|nr:RNA methyltransferase [Ottowia sp.]
MPAAPLPATRFVLIEPSHAGNVGATARAMKVMGFNDLVLVAPRWPDVLARPEAIERASGADDVLARARIAPTLDEALAGMTHLCATVMTPRDFGPPTRSPREHFEMLLKQELPAPATQGLEAENASNSGAAEAGQGVAFLFGCERFGMANDDVYRCHVALSIPTAPDYGSLNLAAAVQLIAYEWRLALGGFQVGSAGPVPAPGIEPLADAAQVAAMLAHWQQALVAVGFLDPAAPKKLMPRLAQLFNRARLRPEEIHILRGVAKAMLEAGERVKR